jgi:uncharacterized protein
MLNSALLVFSLHPATLDGYTVTKRSKSFVPTAELYQRILLDTLDKFSRVPYATTVVFAADAGEAAAVAEAFPSLHVEIQSGDSSKERIHNAVEDVFQEGFRHVVMVPSTIATIPHRIVECAFTLLDTLEDVVVLAPTVQGGYYLLGLRYPHEEILSVADFDAPDLYERTLQAVSANDTALYLLHTWRDLRTLDDARELWAQIQLYPITRDLLPRTSEFLDLHAAHLFPADVPA